MEPLKQIVSIFVHNHVYNRLRMDTDRGKYVRI